MKGIIPILILVSSSPSIVGPPSRLSPPFSEPIPSPVVPSLLPPLLGPDDWLAFLPDVATYNFQNFMDFWITCTHFMFLCNKKMKIQLLEFLLDHQRFRKIPCPENPTELYVVQISFYLSSSFLPFDQD